MTENNKKIVLIGATVTGNRGAESMLQAAIQRIPEFVPQVQFSLLSLYPQDDIEENQNLELKIVPCSPFHLVFIAFPIALLIAILRITHLPYSWALRYSETIQEIEASDLVIDLSGISFVDGRGGSILLYNVLVVLLPFLLGRSLLKYSQALGPFKKSLNKFLARLVLPTINIIATRGQITHNFLVELGIDKKKLVRCSDAAFAMKVGSISKKRVRELTNHPVFDKPVIGIAPSSVVFELCKENKIDYIKVLSSFLSYLIEIKGFNIVLFAHSARKGRKVLKNNDLPVCQKIFESMGDSKKSCLFLNECLNAEELRELIGYCRFLVTSRFHAMISGLSMKVPLLLIGWSHKYGEVLEDFQLKSCSIDHSILSYENLCKMFDDIESREITIIKAIQDVLPQVEHSSLANARLAYRLLGFSADKIST